MAIVKPRSGPNCASIGSAQEALVGVRHNSTLWLAAQARMAGVLFADRLSHMIVDRGFSDGLVAGVVFAGDPGNGGMGYALSAEQVRPGIDRAIAADRQADLRRLPLLTPMDSQHRAEGSACSLSSIALAVDYVGGGSARNSSGRSLASASDVHAVAPCPLPRTRYPPP